MPLFTPPSFVAQGRDVGYVPPSPPQKSQRPGVNPAADTAVREFEGFVLQMFLEAMLPEEASSVFGSGTTGAFWKSMLAEQISKQLAGAGGIGVGRLIADGIAATSRDVG